MVYEYMFDKITNGMRNHDEAHNDYVLRVVQPGLVGLMDGSVSTLAPIFAAAFATHSPHVAFLIGSSAAVGAGISMAFAEALSDTGEKTGRGTPIARGSIVGIMTFIGGILHTLPFLIPEFTLSVTLAFLVVGVELVAIAYVRYHFFSMSFWMSILQVVVGGALVLISGLLIGIA